MSKACFRTKKFSPVFGVSNQRQEPSIALRVSKKTKQVCSTFATSTPPQRCKYQRSDFEQLYDKVNRSNRRSAAANRIRGPQSALTDFLASHNISAQQISSDYQRRLREAQQAAEPEDHAEEDKENESNEDDEDPVERKKRKRKEEKAIMKIKQSKEFKRRKHEQKQEYGSDAEDDDDAIARQMLAKTQPLPGQLDNCEICEKRFTVTPYSKSGPDGGLLCGKCSKELKDEEKKNQAQAKKQKAAPKGRKRQTESDRMMGDVKPGAKSLVEACVRRVADVVQDIDEFGDLPQNVLNRLSQILSKKRIMTSRTLNLFLRPEVDRIDVYDCGKLDQEDFTKIFSFMPDLQKVNLRFAGQMKDPAFLYMVEKCHKLRELQLGATNLVSDKAWVDLFQQRGPQLESLKLSELNDSLRDDSVIELVKHCTNLKRLKLRSCSHMGSTSIQVLSKLTKLEHLTLAVAQQNTSAEALVDLITKLGPNLRTLCLEDFNEADDTVVEAIKKNCTKLTKLRLTGSTACTDRGFADLFDNNWGNMSITNVDLSENRNVDEGDTAEEAEEPSQQREPIGFGSNAFKALMLHSGDRIERLNLHSCRHISYEALTEVFDGQKRYPLLRDIDFSFVTMVDDVVMTGIFKSCPELAKLAVFACFNARDVKIPAGIAVIGLPNAQDNVVIEGDVSMGDL